MKGRSHIMWQQEMKDTGGCIDKTDVTPTHKQIKQSWCQEPNRLSTNFTSHHLLLVTNWMTCMLESRIHSFIIHYGDLYSAPSRLLLRSAPDPCTAKKKSCEARSHGVGSTPPPHE